MDSCRLICLPYAGASSFAYHSWKKKLAGCAELITVELAGRGTRMREPFYSNIGEAIDDVYEMIVPFLNQPYVLFGHSMGSTMCYELAVKLIEKNEMAPMHMILSGRVPPLDCKDIPVFSNVDDDKFIDHILKLGGVDKQVFDNESLSSILLPIIRNDYRILENYKRNEKVIMPCDLSVFYGSEDEYTIVTTMEGWRSYSSGSCTLYRFDGGHFFINNDDVVHKISSILRGCMIRRHNEVYTNE